MAEQPNGEAGASADFALDLDGAAIPFDDALGGRQAEARSDADLLRGEEGIKELAEVLGGDP